MAKNNPKEFDRWVKLDKNNRRYPELTWCPMFKLADIQRAVKEQTSLTDFEEAPAPTCEAGGGCFL